MNELSELELNENVEQDVKKLEEQFCEDAQSDKESSDMMSAIASYIIFIDEATGSYPFRSDNNSNEVQRIKERRDEMCNSFSVQQNAAHSVLHLQYCKEIYNFTKTGSKKDLPKHFKTPWKKIVEAFPALEVQDIFSAFGHVQSALSKCSDKNETWWRVHVWGHLMDNFLMNAPGLNFNREKQSGGFASGSASSKKSDAILFTLKKSGFLNQQVCIFHEEEKPPLSPGGNEELWNCSSRNVPLEQYRKNQGDLIKLFRSMRATLVKRKAGHDERLRCYGIQWVGTHIGIYSMCAGVGAYFVCSRLFDSTLVEPYVNSIHEILCAMLALRCLLVEQAKLEATSKKERSSTQICDNPSTPQKSTLVCLPLPFLLTILSYMCNLIFCSLPPSSSLGPTRQRGKPNS